MSERAYVCVCEGDRYNTLISVIEHMSEGVDLYSERV